MSLQLTTVLTAARDRHPAFHRSRCPNAVVGRFLSDFQNELIGLALVREPHYLEQVVSIALDFDGTTAPGTAGAGTSGGLPGEVTSGSISVVEESAGSLVEPALTADQDAVVVVAERVVASATSTTVTSTGAGRSTDQDANRLLYISAGKGRGQVRLISSNTATVWTVSAAWTTIPDATSMMQVLTADLLVTEENGIVTALPTLTERRGYLVKLSAQGVPQIDYTQPITTNVQRGVPLPSVLALTGGTVRYSDGSALPLTLTTFERRFEPPDFPAAYQMGESLYLCGESGDWDTVTSLEVRYVPIAPDFAALTDYFLVPDAAKPCLVAKAAEFMALRVESMDGISIDANAFVSRGEQGLRRYLDTLRVNTRGRFQTMPESAY